MELLEKNIYNGLDMYREQSQLVFTRRQIWEALGYKNPKISMEMLHKRHKEDLEKFSGVNTVITPGGRQETFYYNLTGAMRICIYSSQRRAKELLIVLIDRMQKIIENRNVEIAKASAQIASMQEKNDRLQAKTERLEANLNSAHASYKAEKAENKRLATIAGLESTKEGRTARAFHDALKMAVVVGGYRLDKMRSQSIDRASRQCIGVYDKEYLYMPLELMQWVCPESTF